MIKNLFAVLMLIALTASAVAQQNLRVRVLGGEKSSPLSGATVFIEKIGQTAVTAGDGYAVFRRVKGDTLSLLASYVGYKSVHERVILNKDKDFYITLQPSVIMADEVLVRATRASDITATTFRNIDKAEIAKGNLGRELVYLLDQTPSVVVTSDAGNGVGYTGIRIRGSDPTRVNVTLNGIPLNNPESMGAFLVNMPDFASSVDNIQIQRGVGTSTNGAGAFGASVNIQTTTLNAEPYAELDNSFGSYNTWKNTVRLGTGLIREKFTLDARLSNISSDGYIDRATSDLKSFFLTAAWYGKKSLLRANVFSGKERTYQAWNGVPEEKLKTDRTYNEFTYEGQTDNYIQTHYQLHYSWDLYPGWSLNAALHYTPGKGYYEEYKEDDLLSKYKLDNVVVGGTTITSTDLVRRRWLDNYFYGTTYSLQYRNTPNLTVTLGGAYNDYHGQHFGEVIWARYASNGKLGDRYYQDEGIKKDLNVFAKAEYQLGQFDLYADLQYRKVNYSFLGYDRNLVQLDQTDRLNFFNPKIGVNYRLDNNQRIYISYAIGNKEPIRDDYTQSSTVSRPKPEHLQNIEAGYRISGNTFNLGLNGYAMLYRDQLILTGQINDVGETIRQNVPQSYRAGIELDGRWRPVSAFSWSLALALSSNKIRNFNEYLDQAGQTGKQLVAYKSTNIALSPSFVGSNELVYRPMAKLEVALISKYVSRQYLDNSSARQSSLDGYFLNDVRISYNTALKAVNNLGVTLLFNNVFGEEYSANGSTSSSLDAGGNRLYSNYYFPQAPANFMMGLNLKF